MSSQYNGGWSSGAPIKGPACHGLNLLHPLFPLRCALLRFVLFASGRENVDCLVRTGISEQDARWALAIVDSRAFTFQPDSPEEQLALVPLVDILNTTSLFKDGVQLWQCSFEPHGTVKEGALLLAEGPVKEGEELLHLYGPNSSATLWMVYGFLENGGGEKENVENLFEICGLEVDVPAILVDDPPELKSSKLEALSRGDLPVLPSAVPRAAPRELPQIVIGLKSLCSKSPIGEFFSS